MLIPEEAPAAETTEVLEDEVSAEIAEPVSEEATFNDAADDVDVTETSDADLTEDFVMNWSRRPCTRMPSPA